MIRRYNYTDRKAVDRSDARVSIQEDSHRFQAALKLDEYGLPEAARVFVEAYRQTSWMRFDFGTVAAILPPEDLRLDEFETLEGILFRVRVTATDDPSGRLLAEGDQISPARLPKTGEEGREPLLPIKPQNLGEEVCRVDFEGRPMLLVNNQFGDWQALARSPAFVCIALPQALREILTRILYVEKYYETEDPADWKACWLSFATRIPGSSTPPGEGEDDRFDDWVNEAVAGFARMQNMRERFNAFWAGGNES